MAALPLAASSEPGAQGAVTKGAGRVKEEGEVPGADTQNRGAIQAGSASSCLLVTVLPPLPCGFLGAVPFEEAGTVLPASQVGWT